MDMDKELNIKIITRENKIATAIHKVGYKDDISSVLEIIGHLENLKLQQTEKLKKLAHKEI